MIDSFNNERDHRHRLERLATDQRCQSNRAERLSVILLSFKRPRNLNKILSCLTLCDFVDEIILSNNNPEFQIEEYLHIDDSRIRIINQPERRYASIRCELSLEAKSEFILAIDDDIFLQPEQVLRLFECLIDAPDTPHGLGGQIFSDDLSSSRLVSNREMPIEALVWLFAYTKQHVNKYFEILDALNINNRQIESSEDVPLSFSGEDYAKVHDFGCLARCHTSGKEGVATWRNSGFTEHRKTLIKQMRELRNFNRDSFDE